MSNITHIFQDIALKLMAVHLLVVHPVQQAACLLCCQLQQNTYFFLMLLLEQYDEGIPASFLRVDFWISLTEQLH